MFIPEYSITTEILRNIANIEYGKAIIENTIILRHWETQLKKEAKVRTITNSLAMDGIIIEEEKVKRVVDKIAKKSPKEAISFQKTIDTLDEIAQKGDIDEADLKQIHKALTQNLEKDGQGKYRNQKTKVGVNPEEILASVMDLFDWYSSLDAKETYPILVAGILHGRINKIFPFKNNCFSVATLAAKTSLKINNYAIKDYLGIEELIRNSKKGYEDSLQRTHEDDFTHWLEYFTNVMASEASRVKEKVILLARDTKLAKASGRVELTDRQERVVMYLQDYGILRNSDFSIIFPDISEDSVLRDLKTLMEKGIVAKRGKTKSSRYELS
jgi:Fic family protein